MSKLTKGYGSTSIQKILTDLKTYLIGKFALKTNIPTKVSDLTNDSGFITKIVDDLVNYYLKSEIYSKSEVDALVTAIKNSRFESVNTLPTEDIKTNVIYLVPSSDPQTSNIKDEYINLDGTTTGWEKIGSTEIDLSGYVTTTQLNTALANYVTSTNLTTILADYATTASVTSAISAKADKVSNATTGNLAGLDASGNLTDSGYTVDSTPTANSGNPVSSGGVYTALTNKTDNTIVSDIESTTTASKAYAVDEYLMLNNILYKVTSAISSGGTIVTSGANANVVAVKMTDEIRQSGGGADLTILAPEFNTTTAYGVGEYVTYDGSLYRFKSVHSAGAWNSSHVVEIKAVGQYVTAGKKSGTTLGLYATAEGYNTTASGNYSHAEGEYTKASGNYSHAEGSSTASGENSHAEGSYTTASGYASHAEGESTVASGDISHTEGDRTTASGFYSHAEGEYTTASGDSSHAGGRSTIAQRKSQTAIGEYNVADTTGADGTVRGDYAFIIGNGTSDNARSNALTLDWDGNLEVAGNVNGTNLNTDTDTATGNPATFSTISEQLSKQTTVNIEPIQDLHGYDKPWNGGAGKNKLPLTVEGLKATNTSGTWSGNQYVKNGITFTVITDENNNVTGIKANGTASGGNAEIRMYTETYASNEFKGYKLTGSTGGSGNTFAMIAMYSNNGTSWANEARQYDGEDLTISDYNYIRFAVIISNGNTVSNQMFYPMVRLATESDATFAPYTNICPISGLDSVDVTVADAQTSPTTSQTYTTTLPTTVYGGTLDLTNGRLVVDRAIVDLGSLTWNAQDGVFGRFYAVLNSAYFNANKATVVSDTYAGYTKINKPPLVNGIYIDTYNDKPTVVVYDTTYPNTSDLNSWISARANCKICYKLATPTITTITPSSLSLLKGLNVVSTNGDTVEVTFNQGSLATLEDVLSVAELIPDNSNLVHKTGEDELIIQSYSDLTLTSSNGPVYITGGGGAVEINGDYVEINGDEYVSINGTAYIPTFIGTTAQWNALSSTAKNKYTVVMLTDD